MEKQSGGAQHNRHGRQRYLDPDIIFLEFWGKRSMGFASEDTRGIIGFLCLRACLLACLVVFVQFIYFFINLFPILDYGVHPHVLVKGPGGIDGL